TSSVCPIDLSLICKHILITTSPSHLALHPFPTRRSSDLSTGIRARSPSRSWSPGPRTPPTRRSAATTCSARSTVHGGRRRASSRSEEHTSELQSRFDLVCSLLLAKKYI